MTEIQAWLDKSRAQADRAADHVANVAAGEERWTMRVPPTDTDTDTMLIGLLDDTLGQALNALQAVLDLHRPFEWSFGYEPVTSCRECAETGKTEPNAEYPCPTVRAIQDAIGDKQ